MMNRRAFVIGLGAVLAVSLSTDGRPAEKVYRIGYLSAGSASGTGNPRVLEAFRQGLREHGWVDGQNMVIEYRYAEGQPDRLAGLANELGAHHSPDAEPDVEQVMCRTMPISDLRWTARA